MKTEIKQVLFTQQFLLFKLFLFKIQKRKTPQNLQNVNFFASNYRVLQELYKRGVAVGQAYDRATPTPQDH